MNLKSILLSITLLANIACTTEAIPRLRSAQAFLDFVQVFRGAVAVGYTQDSRFTTLVNQLASLQVKFSSALFAWADINDVIAAFVQYPHMGNLMVGTFGLGTMRGAIQAPISTDNLMSQLQASLGVRSNNKPLVGND